MTTTKLKYAAAAIVGLIAISSVWALTGASDGAPKTSSELSPVEAIQPRAQLQQAAERDRIATNAQRALCENKLKQIMLATVNYEAANNTLPTDITDKQGKPLLSWRVLILPYLEQDNLFKEFKLDEPWNGEHNNKLLAKMPDIYRLMFQNKDETKTYFQFFSGPGTAFEPGKKLRLVDIPDGTSNTLGVVAAGPTVDWSKPADIAYDPNKPLPKLELPYKNLFTTGFMDGAVFSLKPDLDPKVLRLMIERADGQPIPNLNTMKVKLPLTKEEVEMFQGLLKENEKLLEAITEQVREQRKLIGEIAKIQDLTDIPPGDELSWGGGNPAHLSETLEAMKNMNKELRKLIETAKRK